MSSYFKYNPTSGKIEEYVNDVLVRELDDPITFYVDQVPGTDNERDIGSSSAHIKDLYIKGDLKDGTNSASIADLLGGGLSPGSDYYVGDIDKVRSVTINYDESDRISTVVKASGRTLTFAYNEDDSINTVTDGVYLKTFNYSDGLLTGVTVTEV